MEHYEREEQQAQKSSHEHITQAYRISAITSVFEPVCMYTRVRGTGMKILKSKIGNIYIVQQDTQCGLNE